MSSASLAKHLPEILDRASASREATSDSDDRNCIQHRVGGIHGWSTGHLVCVYNGGVKKFDVKTAGKRQRLWGFIIAGVELPELGECQVLQYGEVGHGS